MSDFGIEETKTALRKEAHKRRAQLHPSLRLDAARDAVGHFLEQVPIAKGEVVAAYWPIRDELDIKHLIVKLMDSGQPVALPVVVGDEEPLELRLVAGGLTALRGRVRHARAGGRGAAGCSRYHVDSIARL